MICPRVQAFFQYRCRGVGGGGGWQDQTRPIRHAQPQTLDLPIYAAQVCD